MVYFDNAATGGFKNGATIEKAYEVMRYVTANPGRSGHRLSILGAEIVYSAREELGKLFNCKTETVIFTKNCTEALNTAIFGLVKSGEVITTVYEHNSVLRPLYALKKHKGIEIKTVYFDKECDLAQKIEQKITEKTSAIIMNAASNVTGEVLPFRAVGEIAKRYNIPFILDGAQAGGHVEIDMIKDNITALALAGHKGLYGLMGTGALLINGADIPPLTYGGTGSQSFDEQPLSYPERLESGTLNLIGISSLLEGVKYVAPNIKTFSDRLNELTETLINGLSALPYIKGYSKPNPVGIVSFSFDGMESQELADILSEEYDIAVRGGFHCAPLIHRTLGTDKDGLIRVSFAVQNTTREISFLLNALERIHKTING